MTSRSRSATTSSSLSRLAVDEHLAARVAEVRLPVELADGPRLLGADAVDGADEVAVRHRVRRLLELPQVLGEPGHGGRRVEHDLGAVQAEHARALGEVAVVADVDADARELRLERRVPEVARLEIELLPEPGRHLRNVVLAVLAEVRAVGVDHGGGVVVHAVHLALVDRHDDRHAVLLREVLDQARRRAVGHGLGEVVPACRLLGAEVRPVEQLLEAEDLHLLARRFLDEAEDLRKLRVVDLVQRGRAAVEIEARLHETGTNDAGHGELHRKALRAGHNGPGGHRPDSGPGSARILRHRGESRTDSGARAQSVHCVHSGHPPKGAVSAGALTARSHLVANDARTIFHARWLTTAAVTYGLVAGALHLLVVAVFVRTVPGPSFDRPEPLSHGDNLVVAAFFAAPVVLGLVVATLAEWWNPDRSAAATGRTLRRTRLQIAGLALPWAPFAGLIVWWFVQLYRLLA